MYSSLVFSILAELCSHYYDCRMFSSAPKETPYPLAIPSTSFSSLPCPRLPVIYFLSLDLLILDISCKWNHTIWGLLCLSFTKHNVFKVYMCYSMYVCFIPFSWLHNITLYGYTMFRLSIHQPINIGRFPFLAIISNVAMNIHVQVSVWTYAFISLGNCWVMLVTLCIAVKGTARLFSKAATPFYNPTSSV